MKFERYATSSILMLVLTTTTLATNSLAADMPKRKPGLWEIDTRMAGMPSMGPIQQCIDQSTDDLMQQQTKKEKAACSTMDIKPQGNKVSIHSVCQVDGSTATTDAVFVGAFDSSYKGDMLTKFNPPIHGMSESKLSIDAKWTGPCKPGQKPGDIIMPNLGGININEMMKQQQ